MRRSRDEAAAAIARWYRAALAAVEPSSAVARHLARDGDRLLVDGDPVPTPGRLVMLGVGKAATAMARGAIDACGDRIETGVVITKDGHASGALPDRFAVYEAAHPIPDERGVRATREALRLIQGLRRGDVLLALISGGGSALLEAPRPPVTLADLAATTDLLLRAGAPIQDLNTVRWRLSDVKAGGLRRAAGEAAVVTLILSDVLGNDPRLIASGPTVPGDAGDGAAPAVLDRYGVKGQVPDSVIELLANRDDSGSATVDASADVLAIVADNETAVRAAAEAVAADGLRADIAWRERQGEAADLGRSWVDVCAAAPTDVDVLLGGGEATVTVRGDGRGGRNTEFALAAALALAERGEAGWTVASLATDGEDGPTDAAGAIADAGTIARAEAAGVDPIAALANNDSLRVFEVSGGLVKPGPTGTNVNDVYVSLRTVPPS